MNKYLFICFLIIVSLIIGNVLMAQTPSEDVLKAGVAAAVKGEVTATSENAKARSLNSGDSIFIGDLVVTGAEAHLQILLLDETIFTLGPSSSIVIDEFVYNPTTDDGKLKANVTKGIFRFVTGKIGHKTPENMEVNLPTGTIGIRGTVVAGIIEPSRILIVLLGPGEESGVAPGRIYVTNIVNGEIVGVDIDEKGFGTIIGGENEAPVPVFLVSAEDLLRIVNALVPGWSGDIGDITDPSLGGGLLLGDLDPEQLADILAMLDFNESWNQQSQDAAQDALSTSSGSSGSSERGEQGNGHITSP